MTTTCVTFHVHSYSQKNKVYVTGAGIKRIWNVPLYTVWPQNTTKLHKYIDRVLKFLKLERNCFTIKHEIISK